MDDIEEEIRRRILAERRADGTASPAPPANGNDSAPAEANGQRPYYAAPAPPRNPSFLQKKQQQGGIVGALATVLLLLAKIGAPLFVLLGKLKFLLVGLKLLTFGKLLLTFGSMLVSMWAYSHIFGWPFAIGIVLLIFIHECGHAFAARRLGIQSSLMVFIPFMGAFVSTKRGGKSIVEDAYIGIMGPVVGTAACVACALLYLPTGNPLWLALAEWGFFVNLFNLAPTVPLDGGWIAPLFSPKLLAFGAVILIFIGFRNPLIWVLGVLSIPRVVSGWKADPKTMPFYRVSPGDRWRYGAAWFGLAAFLGVGYVLLHDFLHVRLPLVA